MTHSRRKYKKINDEMRISEVNYILLNQYNYDLYPFAVSLAIVLNDYPIFGFLNIWELKRAKIPGLDKVKDEIGRLLEIKSTIYKITRNLKRHLRNLPHWHQLKKESMDETIRQLIIHENFSNLPNEDEITQKIYKLQDTLTIIDEEINYLQNNMWKPFRKGPGKSTEPNIIIHAFWSLVIRKNRKADMNNVENLVKWFANKLQNTNYESKLKYIFSDPSIYRFLKENRDRLEKDRIYFFPTVSNSKDIKLPRILRISFEKDSPKLAAYKSSCREKQSPLVCFPDGSTFP